VFELVFALLLTQAVAFEVTEEDQKHSALCPKIISAVNADPHRTWKAGINTRFAKTTRADVKRLLGTIMPGEAGYEEPAVAKTLFTTKDDTIPESYDIREAHKECAPIVGHVRDQSNCGSCWAFGSTEAFNDRHCLATGDAKTLLSPEDTAACCTGVQCSFSMGCNGGQPAGAWNWFTKKGVSTGGDYEDVGTGTTCKPYTLHSCAHHSDPAPGTPACEDLPTYKTPECTNTCSESAYGTDYKDDKMKASSSYAVKGVTNMQKELMEKGTLSVALSVYEDFESYTGGVYQHVEGKYLGGHAVKMIGWGVDNGVPYWLCVNSWNYGWGEEGLFRILRGSNECGIEGSVVAGDV
jgi:cathepsin B